MIPTVSDELEERQPLLCSKTNNIAILTTISNIPAPMIIVGDLPVMNILGVKTMLRNKEALASSISAP